MLLNNGQRQGLLPSKGQQVKQLTLRLGELERERDAFKKQNEALRNIVAMRQVAINALGTHFDVSVEQMKDIIEKFVDAEQKKYEAMTEDMKKKYIEGVRSGTAPDFKIIVNPDAAPAADNVEPFKQE